MNISNEQLVHELEQRHLSLRNEHEHLKRERDSFQEKIKIQQDIIDKSNESIQTISSKLLEREIECKKKDMTIKEYEGIVEDIRDRLRCKSEECDRLRDDIKLQAEQLISQQSRLREALDSLSEMQSQQLPLQYEITKVSRENETLLGRVSWSEKELEDRTNDYFSAKREMSDKILSLESQLSQSASDKTRLTELNKSQADQITLQDEKIKQYMQQIREADLTAASERDAFLKEIDSQSALANTYKKHFEEAMAKVDDVHRQLSEAKEAYDMRANSFQKMHKEKIKEFRELNETMRKDYEDKILVLDRKLKDQAGGSIANTTVYQGSTPEESVVEPSSSLESLHGLSATEVYDRIVRLDKQLSSERAKRRDAEIYLDHVLRTIEVEAPRIKAQQRDYARVVESHEKIGQRLKELAQEKAQWRELQQEGESRLAVAERKAQELEIHNKDLSAQIQHLLKKDLERTYGKALPGSREASSRSQSASGSVISDFLVTFDDISQIQLRNEQLLKAIRKLELDLIEKERANLTVTNTIPMEADDGTLNEAMKELQILRDGRQRLEDMLHSLRSQRDMYKAMLDEADATIAAKTGVAAFGSPEGISTSFAGRLVAYQSPVVASGQSNAADILQITDGGPGTPRPSGVQELQRHITQLEDEKEKLRDRMNRIEETSRAVSEALTAEKQENSSLRMQAAHASAEAKFQTSRASSLEQSLSASQQLLESVTSKRAELEGLLVAQQKEAKQMEERFQTVSNALRGAQETVRRTEAALDASRSAEQRLVNQLSDLRDEMHKQRSLTDSLLRIEAGLTSRADEDMASLIRQRDELAAKLESTRKNGADRTLVLEQRLLSMEDDLRLARLAITQKDQELSSTKEAFLLEQGSLKSAQERSTLLERQLADLQSRYDQVQGNRTIESIAVIDTAQLELTLERTNAEVESLRLQLVECQGHADQFRRISVATEATLKELRERSSAAKAAQEEELKRLSAQIQSLQAELVDKRQGYALAISDVEAIREELSNATKAYNEQLRALENARDEGLTNQQQLNAQIEILKSDALKFQNAAKVAHSNYERELQLHAQAASSIKALEDEISKLQTEKSTSEQMFADQSVAMMQTERLHDEEKKRSAAERTELVARLEDLRRANELLHSQVQGLGVQVDRFYANRVDGVTASSDADPGESSAEVQELRRDSGQLREVIGYMKRERDTLEAKLSVSQSENARHQATVATLQRLLDDTRAELKQEIEKRSTIRDDSEFTRVMLEVTQLNIVRESNAHLRSENEVLARQVKESTEALQKATRENIPLTEKIRSLETTKAVLEAERADLSKDASYWKDRLHQLVSRYNDVDPEEHRQLNQRLVEVTESITKTQTELTKVKAEKSQAEESHRAVLASKDKELAALQSTLTKVQSNVDTFRVNLRKKQADARDMEQRISELTKENAELTKRSQNLQLTVQAMTAKMHQQEAEFAQKLAAQAVDVTAPEPQAIATPSEAVQLSTGTSAAAPSATSESVVSTSAAALNETTSKTGLSHVTEPAASATPASVEASVPAAAVSAEEALRQKLIMSRTMKKPPLPTPPTPAGTPQIAAVVPAAAAPQPSAVSSDATDAAEKETASAVEQRKEAEPPQKRVRLQPTASTAKASSPLRTSQANSTRPTEKPDTATDSTSTLATATPDAVDGTLSAVTAITPIASITAPAETTTTSTIAPPTSSRFAKLSSARGRSAAAATGQILAPPLPSAGCQEDKGTVIETQVTSLAGDGVPPSDTLLQDPEEFIVAKGVEADEMETGLEVAVGDHDEDALLSEAAALEPPPSSFRENAPDLFIDVDHAAVGDQADSHGDFGADVPPPPASSPFLDIRPPSPASASGGRLIFGGKPNVNLPIPSMPPAALGTTGSNPFAMKPAGESLFGPATTGPGSFPGGRGTIPSAFASSTASFLSTVGSGKSGVTNIFANQLRPSGTPFAFGLSSQPLAQESASLGIAQSEPPVAVGLIALASDSLGSNIVTPIGGSAPVVSAPSPTTVADDVQLPVESSEAVTEGSESVTPSMGKGEPEEGEAEVPVVSLSATTALTTEERSRLRRAKFAAVGVTGVASGSPVSVGAAAAASTSQQAASGTKKRVLSQSSLIDGEGAVPSKVQKNESGVDAEVAQEDRAAGASLAEKEENDNE